MQFLEQFVHHAFPGLPGGALTLFSAITLFLAFFLLWRRTKWGGWLAFLFAAIGYAIPFFSDYRP